ncbi:hypothetical protein E4Q08_19370 [Candidatus Accumulibacter phosphatis]|uniref:Uncharacterized protein n=1 Tax=Candidatus Accumulibacter contiguus TaxID=2954381 RepID=A0ABX1TG85_9PROT|nr:hypothetical protein [Candidatus Accumulibacter contiguus]NMQ07242.1 hypothetical protein [Candidatus Accumulibacter contiguus]
MKTTYPGIRGSGHTVICRCGMSRASAARCSHATATSASRPIDHRWPCSVQWHRPRVWAIVNPGGIFEHLPSPSHRWCKVSMPGRSEALYTPSFDSLSYLNAMNKQAALVMTMTGEIFQPVRLYYKIRNMNMVLKKICRDVVHES